MCQNYVSEIKELQQNHVHIKDKDNVNKLLNAIVEGGANKLQIVSDFDRTITKQYEEGKKHLSSFGMFSKCKSVPPEFVSAEEKLTGKYLPIEINPAMPREEKRKYMEEWWEHSEKLFKGLKVKPEEIDEVAANLAPSLRDGSLELFLKLYKANIPALIFSAGLGDSVVSVLTHNKVLHPNVKVISNFLKYENGTIQGFQNKAIHVFNKNEYALKETPYYDIIKDKNNIILMGDSLGDASMADGVPHCNAVLKIGFLYDHVKENLPQYMDAFDIVLENDQSMNVVLALLNLLE